MPGSRTYCGQVIDVLETYARPGEETVYNNIMGAKGEVEKIILSIQAQTTQQMPFETKRQALEDAINLAGFMYTKGQLSYLGREVRKDLPSMAYSSTIRHILDILLPEELAAIQADGEIPKAILDLRSQFRACALDLKIDDSIDRLWLEESDQEDDA